VRTFSQHEFDFFSPLRRAEVEIDGLPACLVRVVEVVGLVNMGRVVHKVPDINPPRIRKLRLVRSSTYAQTLAREFKVSDFSDPMSRLSAETPGSLSRFQIFAGKFCSIP